MFYVASVIKFSVFWELLWKPNLPGPATSSRGTLYQGYFPGLRALQGHWHGGSRIGTDGRGRTGGKRKVGTGEGQRESLCEWGGSERDWIGTAGAAGPAAWEDENTKK